MKGLSKRASRWARTSITYALIPGNSVAEANTRMIIGGQDFQLARDPRSTMANAPEAVFFLS
jgi:hypothetical protein